MFCNSTYTAGESGNCTLTTTITAASCNDSRCYACDTTSKKCTECFYGYLVDTNGNCVLKAIETLVVSSITNCLIAISSKCVVCETTSSSTYTAESDGTCVVLTAGTC